MWRSEIKGGFSREVVGMVCEVVSVACVVGMVCEGVGVVFWVYTKFFLCETQ